MTRPPHFSVLTDEDKARIRAEVIFREDIRREVDAARTKRHGGGLFDFLNSRFFISVVAALGLSFATQLFVRANSAAARAAAHEQAIRTKRLELVTSAANDLSTYGSLRGSWLKKKLWLRLHPTLDNLNGTPRKDVEATYMDLYMRMMAVRRPEAALAEVTSFFESKAVADAAAALDKAMTATADAKLDTEIEGLCHAEDEVRATLLRAMGEEAKAGLHAAE